MLETCPSALVRVLTSRHSSRTGLYAVKVRAEAMQEASDAVPSGMLSVLGQHQSKFALACADAREHCQSLGIKDPVCEVASYLFPDCRVIAGHLEVGMSGTCPQTPWGRRCTPLPGGPPVQGLPC